MIVYRLENSDGDGIYQSGVAHRIEEAGADLPQTCYGDVNRHPTPRLDSLLVANGWDWGQYHLFFAFESYESFRSWFFNDEFLEKAKALGFELVRYETGDSTVILGNAQCAFYRDGSVKID